VNRILADVDEELKERIESRKGAEGRKGAPNSTLPLDGGRWREAPDGGGTPAATEISLDGPPSVSLRSTASPTKGGS
jgi:hypothetical protein